MQEKKRKIGLALEYLNAKNLLEKPEKEIRELENSLKEENESGVEDPDKIALGILKDYIKETPNLNDPWIGIIAQKIENNEKKIVKGNFTPFLIDQATEIGKELSLSKKAREKAVDIIKKAKEKNSLEAKNPVVTLAAALYIAGVETGEWRSQVEVAQTAKVSKSALFKRYKELAENLHL